MFKNKNLKKQGYCCENFMGRENMVSTGLSLVEPVNNKFGVISYSSSFVVVVELHYDTCTCSSML